ncbi:MAG: AzlC family ABC transporter permease [Ruminococcaceae bacterium]|nr:AzlC family ABC transporter permease [Oscillospiraceae bacterium]
MRENNSFSKGIRDGLPICFGYLSVSFAFGIFSIENGLSLWEALFISMTNVTSAGQLAAVPIIASGGTLLELAMAQLVINLRYALMSVSLSQKLGASVRLVDRFLISFVNTDEVFAVAISNRQRVGRLYLYGLILTPFLGWSLGTLLGAGAGNILPEAVTSALGIAIYAMFVAIVIPETKDKATAGCVLLAIALSCAFTYLPVLKEVQSGFVIIICAVVASALFAVLAPVKLPGEEGTGCE